VCIGKAKRKGNVKPDTAYPKARKWVDNIAFHTMQSSGTNTQPMAIKKVLLLGTGAREPGCEQTKKMTRAYIIPALSWDWPIMPGKVMQGRPEGGGSFGNGLLHSRALPRRCTSQGPQAFPTLFHCPGSGQHHNPPDHLTNRRRRVNQPQVPLLKQIKPNPCCT
jgi:hypothetical protein